MLWSEKWLLVLRFTRSRLPDLTSLQYYDACLEQCFVVKSLHPWRGPKDGQEAKNVSTGIAGFIYQAPGCLSIKEKKSSGGDIHELINWTKNTVLEAIFQYVFFSFALGSVETGWGAHQGVDRTLFGCLRQCSWRRRVNRDNCVTSLFMGEATGTVPGGSHTHTHAYEHARKHFQGTMVWWHSHDNTWQ